jgi:hypothetical protein
MFESSVDRLLRLLGVRRAGENGAKPLAQDDGLKKLFDQMVSDQNKPRPRWAEELNFYEKHGPKMRDGGGDDS